MNYLAYGSNMLAERLRRRVPGARLRGATTLAGWELRFHKRSIDGSGKCTLVRSPAAVVHGVVYAIRAAERPALDAAEFLGRGYRRHTMRVHLGGAELTAFTYLAEDGHVDESLAPYGWYLDLVVAGARANGLPADYVRRLAAVPAHRDPDARRRALHRRLLAAAGAERSAG